MYKEDSTVYHLRISFLESISTRRVRVLKHHGFYCNIYILIPSTLAFYSTPDAKQAARHPSEIFTLQFGHVITPDISARVDRCTVRAVRLCSLPFV